MSARHEQQSYLWERTLATVAAVSLGGLAFAGANALQDARDQSIANHLNYCVKLDAATSKWSPRVFAGECPEYVPSQHTVSGPTKLNSNGGHNIVFTMNLPAPQKMHDDNIEAARHQDAVNRAATSGAAAAVVFFSVIGGELVYERRKRQPKVTRRPSEFQPSTRMTS